MTAQYTFKDSSIDWLIATGERTHEYTQVVVAPFMTAQEGDEKQINRLMRSLGCKHDIILLGSVQTNHPLPDGTWRNDTLFLIHTADIGAFATQRFGAGIRLSWLEDILGNDMERGLQTYRNMVLCAYPPTWIYGDTEWDEYPCYKGVWQKAHKQVFIKVPSIGVDAQ